MEVRKAWAEPCNGPALNDPKALEERCVFLNRESYSKTTGLNLCYVMGVQLCKTLASVETPLRPDKAAKT